MGRRARVKVGRRARAEVGKTLGVMGRRVRPRATVKRRATDGWQGR
jgi:hypothetical protein